MDGKEKLDAQGRKRFWVKMRPEAKRQLDLMAAWDGLSTEDFAGNLLAHTVEKAWPAFQAKLASGEIPDAPPAKPKKRGSPAPKRHK